MSSHNCCCSHRRNENYEWIGRCCSTYCHFDCCGHSHSHCGCCRCSGCHHFSIRLAGLQNGLLSRLHRLLWCEAQFKLEDGTEVKGTIISVGSNFVEVLLADTHSAESETTLALDPEGIEVDIEEESATEKREHPIGRSWIFSIDKIVYVEVSGQKPH